MQRRQFIRNSTAGILGAGLARNYDFGDNKVQESGYSHTLPRPNILWIMLDDCRYDTVGCYGRSWAVTPNIDKLAQEGVRFDTAIVQNPVCVPSRRSMKTGFYAHEVGPVEMGREPDIPAGYLDREKMTCISDSPNLLDAWTSMGMKPISFGKIHGFPASFDDRGDAEVLLDVNGNPTEYFIRKFGEDSPVLKGERIFTRTHHWQIGGILPIKPEDTETWRLCDLALETLERTARRPEPFFLRVSFHAPHVACYVPEAYYIDPVNIRLPFPTDEELQSKPLFEQGPLRTYCGADLSPHQAGLCRGTYYGMVSLVDVQVGRLVRALEQAGQLDNTIIAFTSDQGFQLGEHGLWKKRVFYEANVRVPLILRYPKGLPGGRVILEPVELVDFLPTLMELSGLKAPGNIRGASMMPLINGSRSKWREACFSEIDHSQSMYDELRQGTGRRVMVRTREWKLDYFRDQRVSNKDGALYNLIKDPGEQRNLYHDARFKDIIFDLEQMVHEWAVKKH